MPSMLTTCLKFFALAVGIAFLPACWLQGVGPDRFRELMTPIVKKQAAFDLQCTEDHIQVVGITDTSFGATGCGNRASYIPKIHTCGPHQTEGIIKDVCTAVVANVATKNP